MDKKPLKISEIRQQAPQVQGRSFNSKYIKHLFDWNEKAEKYVFNKLIEKGRDILGKDFLINDENYEKVIDLIKYFSGNGGFDNRKGVYLFGEFGVGKTTLMTVLNYTFSDISPLDSRGFPLHLNGFMNISIEKIIEHHKIVGNIDKFIQKKNLCIHEFGKKINEKIYGTDANSIIEALFMIRYELYQDGYLTHVTGNYHPNEVIMPDIIKSRMVEMFNFIEFKGESFRR